MGGMPNDMPPMDVPADSMPEAPDNMPDEMGGAPQPDEGGEFDADFDPGVDASEDDDPKRFIQQLAGKLSQSIRKYNADQPRPDVDLCKYVVGMVAAQAVDGLSKEDANEILDKITGEADTDDDEKSDDAPKSNDDAPAPDEDVQDPAEPPSHDDAQGFDGKESVGRRRLGERTIDVRQSTKMRNSDMQSKSKGYNKKPFDSPF